MKNFKEYEETDWSEISVYQTLTEEFITKFQTKVDWYAISYYQTLSEEFMDNFQGKIDWHAISYSQKLSESFIRKFNNRVDWTYICEYQTLSEPFIEEFQYKVNWCQISFAQKLSDPFIEKFKDKLYLSLIPNQKDERLYIEKEKDIKAYAKEFKLDFDGKYLYCFRNQPTTRLRYWKCDLNPLESSTYGLTVFPTGNISIKVSVNDWGIWVKDSSKARVWAFSER